MVRYGITEDQKHGQQWKEAFCDVSWDAKSIDSRISEISDSLDGNTPSTSSIRADLPSVQFNNSGSEMGNSDAATSLCWVDGTCLSMLK